MSKKAIEQYRQRFQNSLATTSDPNKTPLSPPNVDPQNPVSIAKEMSRQAQLTEMVIHKTFIPRSGVRIASISEELGVAEFNTQKTEEAVEISQKQEEVPQEDVINNETYTNPVMPADSSIPNDHDFSTELIGGLNHCI